MNRPLVSLACLTALSAALLAACGGGGEPLAAVPAAAVPTERDAGGVEVAGHTPASIGLSLIGRLEGGAAGASEITAFDADTKRLFVVNAPAARVDVVDLSDPTAPRRVGSLEVSDLGGAVNSVDVHEGLVAIAVEASPKTGPGKVAFHSAADLSRLAVVTVGAQPDMLVFTGDGKRVVVANEGEPTSYGLPDSVDPEGSVSIIDLNRQGRRITPTVRTATFTAFNGQADALRARGIRIFGPGATVAQDLEPEYVALDANSRTAYVTLQENNAIAVVDLDRAQVVDLRPLGYKNHALAGQGLDPSDEDGGTDTNRGTPLARIGNWPVLAMYMPDAVAAYRVRGETYLLTANEGDDRSDWPGITDRIRVRDYCGANGLAPQAFGDKASSARLLFDSNLGRLRITALPNGGDSGKNAAGECTKLVTYGARSFSIWRASDMARVYDSGEEFERRTLSLPQVPFNSDHETDALDNRSPNKGPEPEALTLGRFGSKTYAFVGLERTGGVMVYDVTDPAAPRFETYVNTRTPTTQPVTAAGAPGGDRGPEGLTLIPANRSPNGKALLVVANEVSGTTAILQIDLGR